MDNCIIRVKWISFKKIWSELILVKLEFLFYYQTKSSLSLMFDWNQNVSYLCVCCERQRHQRLYVKKIFQCTTAWIYHIYKVKPLCTDVHLSLKRKQSWKRQETKKTNQSGEGFSRTWTFTIPLMSSVIME